MLIKQLSIFVANQPGHAAGLTGVLAANGIDIRALMLFDTADYGILRTIVNKPAKALEILKQEGYVAKINMVVGVELEDRMSSLHDLFAVLADAGLNVEYTYCFVIKGRNPIFVVKADDIEKTATVLQAKGYVLVEHTELFEE